MNDERATTGWTTQALGLALSATAMLIVMAVSIFILDSTEAVMYIMTGVAVVGVVVVKRFGARWARALGLLATVLLLGVFYLGFGLFQPLSPIDFIVALLYVLGFLLGLGGGIRAVVRRKGSAGTTGGGRWQPALLAIVGLAAAISIVGFFLTKETVSEAQAAGATPISMELFEFNPTESTVSEGGRLLIHNADAFAHDFTLSDLDIAVSVGPGSDALVDLTGLSPGTYQYICSIHSDGTEGMMGTLVVGS